MPTAIIYLTIVVAAAAVAYSIIVSLARKKAEDANKSLEQKILFLEARLTEVRHQAKPEAKLAEVKKVRRIDESQNTEILDLRRELAKQRDELKRLKEDLKAKERALKDAGEQAENTLYALRSERDTLIAQLRESENRHLGRAQTVSSEVETLKAQLQDSRRDIQRLKEQLDPAKDQTQKLDRALQSQSEKAKKAQDEVRSLQTELKRWQEASQAADGKPLDPRLFVRWRQRALEGRRMYQMMKQLRELSDDKLVAYQDGVIALSQHILKNLNRPDPTLNPGELKADRYLAAAWSALTEQHEGGEPTPDTEPVALHS